MRTRFYIVWLVAAMVSWKEGISQTMVLPYRVKYISDANPYYPRDGAEISERIYSDYSSGVSFSASNTIAAASAQTGPNSTEPQVQTFNMSFNSATVDPNLYYYLSTSPFSGGLVSTNTNLLTDVKSIEKGSYFVAGSTRGQLFVLVTIPQITVSLNTSATQFCPYDTIRLNASLWGSGTGLAFNWYFYTGTNTSDTAFLTSTLGGFSGASINFTASEFPALANIVNSTTSNTSVTFYCIAAGADDKSSRSLTQGVSLSPAGPAVGSVTTTDACPNSNGTTGGGSIILGNVTGNGNYRYILRNGANNTDPCDPNNGTCNSVETSGSFSGTGSTISGIPPGTYTLWVANAGASTGGCAQTFNVTVNSIPALTLADSTHTNVSCAGGSDGSITVHTTGGQAGTVSYQLLREPGDVPVPAQSIPGAYTGLTAGNYNLKVADGCHTDPNNPAWAHTFIITAPTLVTGSFTETDATCGSPGNGQLTATVSSGSGTYNYNLYLGGALVSSQLASTNTSWQVDDLAPGSYSLQVLDAAASSCSGYTTTVTIGGPPALALTVSQEVDPTCNGAQTGSLNLQGAGGTGAYTYSITNTDLSQTATNNTGSFASLAAGHYTAVLESSVSGCTDSYTYSPAIVISQPAAITIGLSPTDVQCYGLQNGSITASLSGGTGTLTPTWQQQISGVWSTINTSATSLSGLSPGAYRLSVTDGNSCNTTSLPVIIAQPALLTIPSVALTDIVCYGGSGTITPLATGGNGGNVFSYSADGGGNYSSFTPGAFFPVGSYLVQVTDSKGCTASYTQAQVITAPSSPLSFTDALSNYNGYNISCYGANTGSVTASAMGGNGSTYNGYNFSVDGGAYQPSPTLGNLAAGLHTIRVEDGRGCVVSQTETLTQPASALSLSLQTATDNDCADGQAGALSIAATGGAAPYQFSIDGGANYQGNGSFSSLATGSYTITAMDQNGCRLAGNYSVASLYPPFAINQTTQAVSCNGGTNGAITLAVSGGAGTYTYQWSELSSGGQTALPGTGPLLTTLKAGTYRALITDAKGCTAADTSMVSQPSALTASLSVHPVCANAASGTITIQAGGGTPPYQYTSNSTYQIDSILNNLSAGPYTVYVMDNNGCTWNQNVTVTTNGLLPSVAFLVSTQQNALDTLEVEDISEPKPDSIQWSFDPLTQLLGTGTDGPLIRYAQPGTYPATMRAFYSGCVFPLTQDILIQPYDPNSASPQATAGLSFDSVLLSPNPNNGTFNLYVKLYKAQRMALQITSLSGQMIFTKEWNGQQLISEPVSLPNSAVSGVYIAELITETEVRDYNIIVTK